MKNLTILRYRPESNWLNQKKSKSFDGIIEFYNPNGDKLGSMQLEGGEQIDYKSNQKNYTTTCTYEFESEICSGSGSTEKCLITYNENCPTSYTSPDREYDYGGGESTAGSGSGSTSTTTSPIPDEEEEEDKIFVELDGKELCAYQRLNYAGVNASNYYNLMTQLFLEFGEGNLGNADLTITSEDLGFSGGKSQYLGGGKFKIIISNMSDRSSIEIAAVILHEMSHAFLAKHYLLYNKSFAELYSMYINDNGLENYSHDIMKDQFLGRMAQTLQDYDSSLFSDFEDYVTLASPGVYSNYSDEQLAEIKRIKNYALQNDSRCTISK